MPASYPIRWKSTSRFTTTNLLPGITVSSSSSVDLVFEDEDEQEDDLPRLVWSPAFRYESRRRGRRRPRRRLVGSRSQCLRRSERGGFPCTVLVAQAASLQAPHPASVQQVGNQSCSARKTPAAFCLS